MIENIEQLKSERPDLVEDFEKMTKEELLNQCYLECIDAINMGERLSVFMDECTLNFSNINYTKESLMSMINEKKEHDVKEFCNELLTNFSTNEEIIREIKKIGNE